MIQLKHLYKAFNGKVIYDDLNLEIRKSETLVVIGRSGCGKSVMLKHIMGIILPDSGEVLVSDVPVHLANQRVLEKVRRKFGMVFQHGALFDSMTVAENVYFALDQLTSKPLSYKRDVAFEKLKMVGLEDTMDMQPSELSGGMQKRVAIARAIAMDPEIILYDEPTTGLDPITADVINDLIIKLDEHMGVTSIVVTHDMASAYKVGERIVMLHHGRVIAEGTPEEVKATENPYLRQFINGHSEGPIGAD